MLRVALGTTIGVLALAGCLGGGNEGAESPVRTEAARTEPRSEAEREQQERKRLPGRPIAAADRIAYYQIATTSGLLRERAATVVTGHRGLPAGTLRAARARLDRIEPASRELATLRDRLATAVDALLDRPSRGGARAAYGASDRVNAGLRRWARGRRVRALVPD